MKEFYFNVEDRQAGSATVYKVMAADLEEAKSYFTKKFCPYVPFEFKELVSMFDYVEIYITILDRFEVL